nr:phosphoenolpyruvate carboxykinase domain-containing protein [Bryobacterales bacterium]
WPGFGENMRVLKWIVDRVHGGAYAIESPVGWMPRFEDLDLSGLDFSFDRFAELMEVDRESWKEEVLNHEELFLKLYDKLPKEFLHEFHLLLSRLNRSPILWQQHEKILD